MLTCFLQWGPSRDCESCGFCSQHTLKAWSLGRSAKNLKSLNSTLSHHLEMLKNEDLVTVRREATYLRYAANSAALQELLGFLYAECSRGEASHLLWLKQNEWKRNEHPKH
jgi:hypothetical protein